MRRIGPQGSLAIAEELSRRLTSNPDDLAARHNLAVELRLLGRFEQALQQIDAAWQGGLLVPETATVRGRILLELGRLEAAAEAFGEAVERWPHHAAAQVALAQLLPQIGRSSEALDGFRRALTRPGAEPALWAEALRSAQAQGDNHQVLAWVEAAEARFGKAPLLATFAASALAGLGRDAEALDRVRTAVDLQADNAGAQATLAYVLIRLREYREAAAAAAAVTRIAPADQSGWALLGTAWRLLDDPREDWLCGYDDLVGTIEIEMPDGLDEVLIARHHARGDPADQSVRGGTQTAGALFHSGDPAIGTLAHRVFDAVETHLGSLPCGANHPFLSRNNGRADIVASWSVRLSDAGFHVSHIHAAGWLSSAFYVSLPDEVRGGSGQGELTFGVPEPGLGLDLPPRRVIQPREGLLVLFPSYLWHGTTLFHSEQPRLTVAFDALPMDNSAVAS